MQIHSEHVCRRPWLYFGPNWQGKQVYALFFNMSQNDLCWYKTIWQDQKIKLHLVLVQTIFVLSQKLKNWKSYIGLSQKVWYRHNMSIVFWSCTKSWDQPKIFLKGQGIRPPKCFLNICITELEKLQDVVMFIVNNKHNNKHSKIVIVKASWHLFFKKICLTLCHSLWNGENTHVVT